MVVLTDEPKNRGTPFEPTGENMMKAFNWLVTCNNPGDSIWLSYSGHGSQVKDPDGDRESGFDDTICPLDFETNGQIDSDTLHKALVSPMDPRVRMTVLFDCCHSGSAIELPFVYRPNSQGEVNLVDNIKKGISLATQAYALMHGHFTAQKIKDAQMLIGGAKSLLASFQHRPNEDQKLSEDGLGEENFVEDWKNEGKDVWMFSGCADDQTSADTSIAGAPTGISFFSFDLVIFTDKCRCDVTCVDRYLEAESESVIYSSSSKHERGSCWEVSADSSAVLWWGI